MNTFARGDHAVKAEVVEKVTELVNAALDTPVSSLDARSAEDESWEVVLKIGRLLLGAQLGMACRAVAEEQVARRKLPRQRWAFRLDQDYWAQWTTTFGRVSFPFFAIRLLRGSKKRRTLNPARRRLFPYYGGCRSSPLCLEWECKLGATMPFRRAETTLTMFTHHAVTLEDTTIARHTTAIGSMIEHRWLYRSPTAIAELVNERATRCLETGRPLVYVSSDAHALRRYVDETWHAPWKMANGVRVWSIDRQSGELIHLGGEFTWGDCRRVAESIEGLISSRVLPPNGDYGGDKQALYVWLSDGMPWFDDHLLPLFEPDSLLVVLDAYHVLERFGELANALHRTAKSLRQQLYQRLARLVTGDRNQTHKPAKPKRRRGHRKGQPKAPAAPAQFPPVGEHLDYAAMVLATVGQIPARAKRRAEALDNAMQYLTTNAHRIDYAEYRRRGIAIGSGPMESLHRVGSQLRLKLPGARWTEKSSQAIFNLRMMDLVGNTKAFWQQAGINHRIAKALAA